MTEPAPFIDACTECGNCVKQCAFLQRHGTPAALARRWKTGELPVDTLYSCNLCRLCDVFCPEKIEPSRLFLQMRREAVSDGKAPLPDHKRLLSYERIGLSTLFTLSALPDKSRTVFFPGCALAGTRPTQTLRIFEMLQEAIPELGIMLNCCAKPSHDLGRSDFFNTAFGTILGQLTGHGIDTVITACPSCHQVFETYGDGLNVISVYELLADRGDLPGLNRPVPATLHDPCATRFNTELHDKTRTLAANLGVELKEMKHRSRRTLCCGEGGAACFIAPDITKTWAQRRHEQAADLPVLTYCAGCVAFYSKKFQTIHLIDLLLDPDAALKGDTKTSTSPFTYLNRLRLKWKLKRMIQK